MKSFLMVQNKLFSKLRMFSDQSCVNQNETVHETLHFLFLLSPIFMEYARLCSKENFREPFGLPSILARTPRPESWSPEQKFWGFLRPPKHSSWDAQASKLVVRVHLTNKYFVCTPILLACLSPNLAILAFACDKNPHVVI